MASPEGIIEAMRRTPLGHHERDFRKALEYYGFEERPKRARHGAFFRSAELASHADRDVRMRLSWVIIPGGCEDKDYVVPQVLERVALIEQLRQGGKER